jgi:hypothetical protein
VLHSPLSPLTPSSTIFPDGLVDPRWIGKHQELLPSVFITFHSFTSNPQLSTLHDNQLKSDVNNIKGVLSKSGHRTRLVVVLLSEESIIQSPEIEDRLANVRKATVLDPKSSLFFLPPNSSSVELATFAETVITTNYPLCIEYYRDLSKHTRRKRNRGFIPPPTLPPTSGTSQTLSSQGWNVRYDFKLGVFAEFRQEMDAALRSFESSYEGLLGNDVFEIIASWSPRWNEARMLADVIVIRIIRCLLWIGQTSAASVRWQAHREMMRDLVDRRGKGSSTYGWEAWEARWATVMAEIIRNVQLPDFTGSDSSLYLSPEKSFNLDVTSPWDYLHHPGYWHKKAATHSYQRRTLVEGMPDDDKVAPDACSASQLARNGQTYDTYLCPEPHVEATLNHSQVIEESLNKAISEFEARGQTRLVQELQIQSAKLSIRAETWDKALEKLKALWQDMTFRQEGYLDVVEDIGWALRTAASHEGDGASIVAVDWELLNRSKFLRRGTWLCPLRHRKI